MSKNGIGQGTVPPSHSPYQYFLLYLKIIMLVLLRYCYWESENRLSGNWNQSEKEGWKNYVN